MHTEILAKLLLPLFAAVVPSSAFGPSPSIPCSPRLFHRCGRSTSRSPLVGLHRHTEVGVAVGIIQREPSFRGLKRRSVRREGPLRASGGDDLESESDDDDKDIDDDDNSPLQQSSPRNNPRSDEAKQKSPSTSSSTTPTPPTPHDEQRPSGALPWMPTRLITLRPRTQLLVGLALYVFHLRVLTQYGIAFPFQLIPNEEGWFQSIGLDSLAGMAAFAGLAWLRKSTVRHMEAAEGDGETTAARFTPPVPSLWSDPTESEAPWRLRPRKNRTPKKKPSPSGTARDDDAASAAEPHPRSTSVAAFVLLTVAYFSTGRFSLLFENGLYAAAGYGVPLTVAMHRSLVVLLGHWTWVAAGSAILSGVLSPKPFFGGGWSKEKQPRNRRRRDKSLRPYRWYTNRWDTYWLWWTIGGYFVSAWLFNVADFVNQILLPPALFAQPEGVVSQLINPENNDFLASLVGYIAPCLSAPWWEEVLYRGYLLPALGLFMGFWPSVFVSGVLFSVHHLSVMGAIPLAVLGWVWALLYAKSGNILVTILIHGMWNSRVFLGSWLGL
mmetsp:Transcript_6400/g.12759  ORF Transcript_6400/g.12759 Transcript_6400/m.12759 type:complete len:552 (+) Transcript_6400:96-1751(+)